MSSDRHLTAGGFIAATFVVTLTFLYSKYQAAPATKNGIPLPPGPPVRWFWESAFPQSSSNIFHTLGDWVAKYGPVMSLREGSRVTIVIGRLDAAEAYEGLQREHARDVILDILRDPKHHIEHAQRFAASVVLRVIYGKSTPTSNDDPEVVRIHQSVKNLQPVSRPGSYLVDTFPILKHVPGYGRELWKYHEFELALFRDQLGRSRNEANPSFGKTLLENTDDHQMSYDEMAYLSGCLFGAGSDTTANTITTFIMAAARHPEAQARVQEELDIVVGTDRGRPALYRVSPTFEDWSELPQLHAFMSETLRWRPIVPIGVTHRATEDIIWRGQIIPAGATVLGCHWAISRDPVAYPDPEKFNPQRWLDPNGQLRTDLWFCAYGFGRRVCPGLHLANRSLYINLALLLWSFRISERPDAPIDVDSFTDTVISRSAPFEVEFVPRMEEEKLREMMEEGM
ncbi:cytochrome P450 [Melanogaster broomeanus]|nr:cytochrome P450 [Melanogaster broomeanus]